MRLRLRLIAVIALVVLAGPPVAAQVRGPIVSIGLRPLPRPTIVRGLYVNRWAVLGKRMWELMDVARRTEVNALVIDVKDDRGYVLYRSAVPLARTIGAVRLGFSEVQFDYVRFPDAPHLLREATFPLAKGRRRALVIREQLGFMRERLAPLAVPVAIDVFGLTTSDSTDMGIGQQWEQFAEQSDIVLPMTYPSHYARGTYGITLPNAHPYEIIAHALQDAQARKRGLAKPPEIVPWYQDFTLGSPRYGVRQLRAQMQAGYDNDIKSWMLWNPGSRYTIGALEVEKP